jgi:glucose-1-phosphate thymidylyltransferase
VIKKGIILAGGTGSRLSPITKAVNKQLLPLYDKPLLFYPLSVLMLAKIRNILIIVSKGQIEQYKKILPNGKNLGINITYKEQNFPAGLPEAFIIGEKFINKDPTALILGDNFFFGQSLTKKFIECTKLKKGAKILLYPVKNPSQFGIATINKKNKIINIIEKPLKTNSNLAVTGFYFFDGKATKFSKSLKPSKRNELEIIDLLKKYKKYKQLSAEIIGRGGTWLDTGTVKDFNDTSNFVATIENRQGLKIGCLEEIAFNNNWIGKLQIEASIKFYGKCDYSKYLNSILKNN